MKETPIYFLDSMVRAILAGQKTQTRRIIKGAENAVACNGHCPKPGYPEYERDWLFRNDDGEEYFVEAPYLFGDRLEVRGNSSPCLTSIILEVTGVRVERVQDISEEDALAEGIKIKGCEFSLDEPCRHCKPCPANKIAQFKLLWDSIYANRPGGSWDDTPWVWVVEFKRVEMPLFEQNNCM